MKLPLGPWSLGRGRVRDHSKRTGPDRRRDHEPRVPSPARVRRPSSPVPTWAPLLSVNLARTNWWRSSRPKGSCDDFGQHQFAMQDLRQVNVFGCTYHTGRLLYTVTYVPSNHVTNPSG